MTVEYPPDAELRRSSTGRWDLWVHLDETSMQVWLPHDVQRRIEEAVYPNTIRAWERAQAAPR